VVYGPRGFWAFQVQNSADVRPADLRPLRAFREDYPESTGVLLYRGSEKRRIEDLWCLPAEAFLRDLHPARGLVALAGATPPPGRLEPGIRGSK
jgi:hypothetical protein